MLSLSERLAKTNGRPAGFDYMRVGLASFVVLFHSFSCYDTATFARIETGPLRPVWAMILPMFFGLSGFLVSGSLERSATLVNFLGLRAIRLLPALVVECVLSLVIIGALFTTLPLHDFFADRQTHLYLLNIVGDVHFFLPGVFTDNPASQKVNGQLWTLPYELKCYIVISALAVVGAYRSKMGLLLACAALQIYCSYRMFFVFNSPGDMKGVVGASALVLAFVYGVAFYRFRDHIRWDGRWFAVAMPASFLLMYANGWNTLAILPAIYGTVYLGLLDPVRNPLVSSGDYSYGIYLYSWPIQQAVVAALPNHRTWWENLLISVPLIMLTAAGSWHLVEKRALKLRPLLALMERHWLPINERISNVYARLAVPGLKARWARNRPAG